mmetsp:Transcript_80547/g.232807  ORF Transcript_80547/g.232807 Transcript_80547/m.232807 type:complete len:233 (+) Transcript_80547:265-963(+)
MPQGTRLDRPQVASAPRGSCSPASSARPIGALCNALHASPAPKYAPVPSPWMLAVYVFRPHSGLWVLRRFPTARRCGGSEESKTAAANGRRAHAERHRAHAARPRLLPLAEPDSPRPPSAKMPTSQPGPFRSGPQPTEAQRPCCTLPLCDAGPPRPPSAARRSRPWRRKACCKDQPARSSAPGAVPPPGAAGSPHLAAGRTYPSLPLALAPPPPPLLPQQANSPRLSAPAPR